MTPEFTREDQIEWFNSLKDKKDYLIWGIICNSIPIGVCGLKNIEKRMGEYWGYIGDKNYWGKGIGKIIMSSVINQAKILGLHRIYLKVSSSNHRAINLYKSIGFTISKDSGIIIMSLELSNNA